MCSIRKRSQVFLKKKMYWTIELARALELIKKKDFKNRPLKSLGEHPETGDPVDIFDGRYGPYVKTTAKRNASLQGDQTPEKT